MTHPLAPSPRLVAARPPKRAKESTAEYNHRAYWWRMWAAQERPDLWFTPEHVVREWQEWIATIDRTVVE